jgi:hypothetical protein
MFRASSLPSSGEHKCVSLPMVFCPGCPESRVARCVHCCCLSGQPVQKTIGSDTQFCSPDDGSKNARNMLRNNWLPINQYLLHLVGLAFICLYKMHGHSSIKNRDSCFWQDLYTFPWPSSRVLRDCTHAVQSAAFCSVEDSTLKTRSIRF